MDLRQLRHRNVVIMTTPSEQIKNLAQQCCDEIEGHCYRDSDDHSYSSFDTEKALALIEVYMLRALADVK